MPSPVRTKAYDQLESLLADRILLLDGAMGTMIMRLGLDEAGVRGERFADHRHDKNLKNFSKRSTCSGSSGVSLTWARILSMASLIRQKPRF